MAPVSTAMAKNVIRRAFSQLVDPSPDKIALERIWSHFESSCAYCGRSVTRGSKEGHIDHLESASVGGRNHLANRVLACAPCNEREKRDMHWEDFLRIKATSEDEFAARHSRIIAWRDMNAIAASISDQALFAAAEAAAREVTELFDLKVKELKSLLKRVNGAEVSDRVSREHRVQFGQRRPTQAIPDKATREPSGPSAKIVYTASRLSFKADLIEPLTENDVFRIETPEGSFEMTKADFYRDFQKVTETNSYKVGRLYHFPSVPERARKYRVSWKTSDAAYTLDQVVEALGAAQRRATYGVVGRLVGKPATFLMQGRERDARHIWIVNQQTGLPTGYNLSDDQKSRLVAKPVINQIEVLKDLVSRLIGEQASS